MLLILQIALGIVLAVVILRFWKIIFKYSLVLLGISLVSGLLIYLYTKYDQIFNSVFIGIFVVLISLLTIYLVSMFWTTIFKALVFSDDFLSNLISKISGLKIGFGEILALILFLFLGFVGIGLIYSGIIGKSETDNTNTYSAGIVLILISVGLSLTKFYDIKKRNQQKSLDE